MNHLIPISSQFALLFAILWGCLVSGCRPDGPPHFAVSGQITYDGQLVTNGNIGFIPTNTSTGKSAGCDVVDGRYEIPRYEGLPSGSYKVVIYAERPTGRRLQADEGSSEMVDQLEQYIPEIYNARSRLMVEITEDREVLNFDLEKPKRSTRRRR